jgi:hypothetical protein
VFTFLKELEYLSISYPTLESKTQGKETIFPKKSDKKVPFVFLGKIPSAKWGKRHRKYRKMIPFFLDFC